MYKIEFSKRYQRDYKLIEKRGLNKQLLNDVIRQIASGNRLPIKHRDHPLRGKYVGYRECHLQPDWLLIYKIDNVEKILKLARTGAHSDLF